VAGEPARSTDHHGADPLAGEPARWTDNHCHLDPGPGGAEAAAEARAAGVARIVTVGTDPAHSAAAVETARALDGVWATAGVHPHEARHGVDGIEALLDEPEVVAVGECGLDYHYDHSPRPVQREVFAAQVAMANRRRLPLVIHTREAWDDTFAVLAAEGVPERTVFHCFTGGPDEARRCLDLGAHLSFSGIVTFPSAADLREAAAACPLDRLLVETDSPYLTPVPHRGRPNRPAYVPLVGAGVAAAKGIAVEAVAEATWRTASAFYGLPG
jgi:TatD DNase family protein